MLAATVDYEGSGVSADPVHQQLDEQCRLSPARPTTGIDFRSRAR
jgi:hypothetical protein